MDFSSTDSCNLRLHVFDNTSYCWCSHVIIKWTNRIKNTLSFISESNKKRHKSEISLATQGLFPYSHVWHNIWNIQWFAHFFRIETARLVRLRKIILELKQHGIGCYKKNFPLVITGRVVINDYCEVPVKYEKESGRSESKKKMARNGLWRIPPKYSTKWFIIFHPFTKHFISPAFRDMRFKRPDFISRCSYCPHSVVQCPSPAQC